MFRWTLDFSSPWAVTLTTHLVHTFLLLGVETSCLPLSINQIDAMQSKGIGEGLVPFFLGPETYCVSCESQKLRNDLAETSLWSYPGVRISISNAVGR